MKILQITYFPISLIILFLLSSPLLGQESEGGAAESEAEVSTVDVENSRADDHGDAIALFEAGDYEGATKKLNDAYENRPEGLAAYLLRAAILTRKNDWNGAAQIYRAGLKKFPDAPALHFNLGELLFLKRHYIDARNHFRKGVIWDPDNPIAAYKIFLCYLLEGQQEEARKFLFTIKHSIRHPGFYYAHAAWQFGNSNVEGGFYFVNAAKRLYAEADNVYFLSPLVSLGWISEKEASYF